MADVAKMPQTPVNKMKKTASQAASPAKSAAKKSAPQAPDAQTASIPASSDHAPSEIGEVKDKATEKAEDVASEAKSTSQAAGDGEDDVTTTKEGESEVPDTESSAQGTLEVPTEVGEAEAEGEEIVQAGSVDEQGRVVDDEGNVIGKIAEGDSAKLAGSIVDQDGDIIDKEGNVIGKAEPLAEGAENATGAAKEFAEKAGEGSEAADGLKNKAEGAKPDLSGPFKINHSGEVADSKGDVVANLADGEKQDDLAGKSVKDIDEEGNLVGKSGTILGKADMLKQALGSKAGGATGAAGDLTSEGAPEDAKGTADEAKKTAEGAAEEAEEKKEIIPDISTLEGFKVNKGGNIIGEDGWPIGRLVEGNPKKLAGKECDEKGQIWDGKGNVIGRAETLPIPEEEHLAPFEGLEEAVVDRSGNIMCEGKPIGKLVEGDPKKLAGQHVDDDGDVLDKHGNVVGKAERTVEEDEPEEEAPDLSALEGLKVNKAGKVVNAEGHPIGELVSGNARKLIGKEVDKDGKIWDDKGKVIGECALLPEVDDADMAPFEDFPDALVEKTGIVTFEGKMIGKLVEGDAAKLAGKKVDADGDVVDKHGNVLGKAERAEEEEPEPDAPADLSALDGLKVNKAGNVVDKEGNPIGRLVSGNAKKLNGKTVDAEGKIWDDKGRVIGECELLPETEEADQAPFEDFPDALVDKSGAIVFEGQTIGKLVEGDPKKLAGKKVDADGEVIDKHGNVLGKAERTEEEEAAPVDLSALQGKKVNKSGNVVDDFGVLWGRVVEGDVSKMIGKKVDEKGQIWNDSGKVMGRAELVPEDEREKTKISPFEDFVDAVVGKDGLVKFNDVVVGKLVEGDAKLLAGKKIDKEGDILDRNGNVLGHVERYEEEEAPEVKVDNTALAGKRVNKHGNVVDSAGIIYGKIVEGDPAKLAGKMCDKDGNIWNEGGTIVGRAEAVPESEREGQKTGPFSDFIATVTKDGTVQDGAGQIVGRLTEGDPKKLAGRKVDPDGDILDSNGNVLGKAERWEPEEKEKTHSPLLGRKVNKEGKVFSEDGELLGELTEGDVAKCVGKECDDDGDVVDGKGHTIGHVSLLADIRQPEEPEPEPEPTETPEEAEARKKAETDKELAIRMANIIDDTIEQIQPILKEITSEIDAAQAKKAAKEDVDEQRLVDTVKPLIERGGTILTECNGAIRALDPDKRIQSKAKADTRSGKATPEEVRLAELLKQLTCNITEAIENAKKKIAGMPHAEKKLNPLWGLLSEPLAQILAAVGLLLSGVLGLVGKLLSGLGLGGLVSNLLGGLGITRVLDGLGLGKLLSPITGK